MSHHLLECLHGAVDGALPEAEQRRVAAELTELAGQQVYAHSITAAAQTIFFLARENEQKSLGMLTADKSLSARFDGAPAEVQLDDQTLTLTLGATNAANAAALREVLPFLVPRPLGLQKSAGCGDRLGLATPGHIRAIRQATMQPILAQQSIRENARTGRTPQQVMDDALWGVLQEGWRDGFGADADHLKNTDDIDACAAAGFTFYTIDPGEHVDNEANTAPVAVLQQKLTQLDWNALETDWAATQNAFGQRLDFGEFAITISPEELARATAKYGPVVAHTARMYRHLEGVMNGQAFELEMSVDETETVTTLPEHIYIAHELQRLGVKWVSLAPRYVGDFEKGVDYIGNLAEFERSFAGHLAVAQRFGPYKLSLHSGSDKFSIYPIAARVAGELVHLKTAGTSYLEALRAIALINPPLFRQIVQLAQARYPTDRASYHVSAELGKMPLIERLPDEGLDTLLDDFHAREILHVTFGSVLHHPDLRQPFFAALRSQEEVYYELLEKHFGKHFAPFGEAAAAHGD